METTNTVKTGLILEGGAMRGLFTTGILDVWMENDITFDGAIGVSAGAAFGCNFKSKQAGRAYRYNTTYSKDWRYCSYRSLLLTGDLYGSDFCYNKIPLELDIWDDEAFANNPMEFYCVATNAENGEALYHKCDDGKERDLKWIQGSASMPIVSRAVEVDGYKLLDGGISDSVPYRYFESIGYNRNVVVLTQPMDYRKQPFEDKTKKMMKAALHQYPKVYDKIENRYEKYNEQIADICKDEELGKCFVIRPDESLNIGSISHDKNEMTRVYYMGRKKALETLQELKQFLNR